jgi:hemerythrin
MVRWKEEYKIGQDLIDNEHQKLFDIANEALSIISSDEKTAELKLLVEELYTYIAKHFTHEETYMISINYPEIDHHKELHKGMLTSLNDLILEINLLDIDIIQKKLMDFIHEYFIKHIITEDKKIKLWQVSLYDLRKSFGWREVYKIGNDEIDLQHKKLFDIASEAFIIVNDNQRDKKIRKVLNDLYAYMKEHFQDEEYLM